MFKKLKDKIAEEVKQSPLKSVQQLAQAVVSPSSSSVFEPSSSNDKFCIEEGDIEDDEKQSATKSPAAGGGFTSVTLTGQTSSPARFQGSRPLTGDSENLFPTFEPQPTNFHVQSDWESASEVEDRGQLEHISKENLYDAYRKVYGRYNRMKNKYQELVIHYRQLEREKDKFKSVLTETQDKALLRISELREQCTLEQQAKAHLEEALRNELEERDHIISSLNTKVQYLKNANEGGLREKPDMNQLPEEEMDNMIDFTENSCVSKVPSPLVASSHLESLEWFSQQLKNCNKFILNKSKEIEHLKSQLEELKEKNVNITEFNLEAKTCSDELVALQSQSPEESKLFQTLVNIASDFSDEIKIVQNNMQNLLQHSDNRVRSVEETIEIKPIVSTIAQDAGNMELSRHQSNERNVFNDDEIKTLNLTINDLKEHSEKINQRLVEEEAENQQLCKKISALKEVVDYVQKTVLENIKDPLTQVNNFNQTQEVETDVKKLIDIFLSKFLQARTELIKLESAVKSLENELATKNQADKLIKEINTELIEHLERLKNENNDRLAELQSMTNDLNEMIKQNGCLEAEIKETKTLLDKNVQQECNSQLHLKETTISFEKEKKLLQNEITTLNQELNETKTKLSDLCHLEETTTNQISSLQKEIDNMLVDKENLQLNVTQLEQQIEQHKQDYLATKTLNTSLTEELATLKTEYTNAINEKTIMLENSQKLETSVKDINEALKVSKLNFENLQKELLSKTKTNSDLCADNNILQEKLEGLLNEIEQMEKVYLKAKEDKDILSEEVSSLKKEYEDINIEHKELKEKVVTLSFDIDSKMKDFSTISEEKEILSEEILNLRNEHDLIITEKNVSQLKLEDLDKELKIIKDESEKLTTVNENLSVEVASLNESLSKLYSEKKELQHKIVELENINSKSNSYFEETNILKNSVNSFEKELEMCKEDYGKSLTKLTNEITSLNKNKEDLERDRKALEIVIENLNLTISIKEDECLSTQETLKKLSDEFSLYRTQHDSLLAEKENLLKKIKSLEEAVENNESKMLSLQNVEESLSSKIIDLNNEIDSKLKNEIFLQDKISKLVKEHEENQLNHESLLQERNKLSDELLLIREECEKMVCTLNETKEILRNQHEYCDKLKNEYQELSQSYELKCNDLQNQQQENAQLRVLEENLTQELSSIKMSVELLTDQKKNLTQHYLVNLETVKIIRQMQYELFIFVGKLKKEVTDELNEIKQKISNDLAFQVNGILKTYEDHDKQIHDLQCKNKKEVDLYNSKLKNLKIQFQNDDNVSSSNILPQDFTNSRCLDASMGLKDSIETDCILKDQIPELYSQKQSGDVEISLNHALSILKSVHSFLKLTSSSAGLFLNESLFSNETSRESNPCVNEREKLISDIELVIEKCKTADLNSKVGVDKINSNVVDSVNKNFISDSPSQSTSNFDSNDQHSTSKYINQSFMQSGKVFDETFVQKLSSSDCSDPPNSNLEVQQLKQEIKLKEEKIQKLQFIVEEFEREKEMFSSKSNERGSKDSVSLLNNENTRSGSALTSGVVDENGTNMNNDQRIILLKVENDTLLEKLDTMKQTYETKLKCLAAEYENKLKNEEDKEMVEVQKSGKEKKFILNEMKEQIENLQHDLDERGDAFEKLYEEHQQLMKSKDEDVRQLRMNYEKEMREQDKKWRACLDRKLAEEELRHTDEMKTLSHQWAAEKKELEVASQLAVSVVESGTSTSDLLRRQVQSLTLEVSQLQKERCKCKDRRKSPTPSRTIQDCTEMEYLRNILYDYMLGKEPLVLAKVLCALMKFSENQTNNIIIKEEQRLTLLGQLGIR